jgi:hypothetical protein
MPRFLRRQYKNAMHDKAFSNKCNCIIDNDRKELKIPTNFESLKPYIAKLN